MYTIIIILSIIYFADIPFDYHIALMVLALDKKRLVLSGCDANRWADCKSVRVIPPWELNACVLR